VTRGPALAPVVLLVACAAAAICACGKPPQEPLQLDGNILTVANPSSEPWTNVEIWLNTYYRLTTASIEPHQRFQTSLDNFVAGFGQRFEFRRMQVKDLRLVAKRPDGTPITITKEFRVGGLGALKGRS